MNPSDSRKVSRKPAAGVSSASTGASRRKSLTPFADSGDFSGIGWFVGPEGGFTAEEEAQMREHAFRPLHMNGWILRAETAAVCGLAVLRDGFLRRENPPSARSISPAQKNSGTR
ncbi:MAG: RNA methyltransferase [Lentisphaeria bacterium]|nr:RNA methyltransferase [Lentisphaeria bacterium]